MPSQFSKLQNRRWLWLILATGLALRIAWACITPAMPVSDFDWYHSVAEQVAQGNGYRRSAASPLTALRPPGYPLFLAAVYRLASFSQPAARIANAFLGAAVIYLTYLLAQTIYDRRHALLAAALAAFTPSLILYNGLLASENLAAPLLIASMVAFVCAMQSAQKPWFLLAGALLGLATLTHPNTSLLVIFFLGYWALRRPPLRLYLAGSVLTCLALGLVVAPWSLRNTRVFGRFIPLSTNSGINLVVSMNEVSRGRYVPGHQIPGLPELDAQKLDEPAYDRAARQLAWSFIRQRPLQAVILAPLKLFQLWRDDVSGVIWAFYGLSWSPPVWLKYAMMAVAQGYYLALLAGAVAALWLHRKKMTFPWASFLLTPVCYWCLLHCVFFGDDRYHLPLLPLLAIGAAFTLSEIIDHAHLIPFSILPARDRRHPDPRL